MQRLRLAASLPCRRGVTAGYLCLALLPSLLGLLGPGQVVLPNFSPGNRVPFLPHQQACASNMYAELLCKTLGFVQPRGLIILLIETLFESRLRHDTCLPRVSLFWVAETPLLARKRRGLFPGFVHVDSVFWLSVAKLNVIVILQSSEA